MHLQKFRQHLPTLSFYFQYLKWKEIVLKLMVLYPFNDIEQDLEQNLIYILLCNDEFKVLNEQELAFSKKLEDYIEQWNNL